MAVGSVTLVIAVCPALWTPEWEPPCHLPPLPSWIPLYPQTTFTPKLLLAPFLRVVVCPPYLVFSKPYVPQ